MEILRLWRLLRDHWIAALAVVVLTAAGMAGAAAVTPTTYTAPASYALLFPPRPPTPQDAVENPKLRRLVVSNPLLNFDSKGTATEVLAARMQSDDVRGRLREAGLDGDYEVAVRTTGVVGSGSPILTLTARDTTRARVLDGARALDRQLRAELRGLQGAAVRHPAYLVRPAVMQAPGRVDTAPLSRIRVLVAVFAAGLLILITLLSILDARELSGSRRGAAHAEQ